MWQLPLRDVARRKQISIELVFARKYLKVVADKRKIQQVLYNLLDNAIKFSDQDSIITIETTERGDKGLAFGQGLLELEFREMH